MCNSIKEKKTANHLAKNQTRRTHTHIRCRKRRKLCAAPTRTHNTAAQKGRGGWGGKHTGSVAHVSMATLAFFTCTPFPSLVFFLGSQQVPLPVEERERERSLHCTNRFPAIRTHRDDVEESEKVTGRTLAPRPPCKQVH